MPFLPSRPRGTSSETTDRLQKLQQPQSSWKAPAPRHVSQRSGTAGRQIGTEPGLGWQGRDGGVRGGGVCPRLGAQSLSESRSKQSLWGVPSSCCWTRSRRASHRHRAPELAPNPAPSLPELTAGNENDPSLYKSVTHRDQEGLWQRLVTSSDSSCQAVQLLQQGLWLSPRSWESLALHW